MALWQYEFFVIPQESFLENNMLVKKDLDGIYTFDDSIFWAMAQNNCDLFDEVKDYLPLGDSWHKYLTIYGKIDSTCLEVLCENKVICSVSLRIDFSFNYENVLDRVIQTLQSKKLLLLSQDLKEVTLDMESIKNVIQLSEQFSQYEKLRLNH